MSGEVLKRQLGLGAAVMLGLGSMVGAGVFVSLGLGAGLVGPAVLGAIVLAGGLAMCNGLSSAQLAAAHPVAGGTYEYAHRVGWPALGAVAGFVFLVAKSASCATAALGLAGYVLRPFDAPQLVVPGALAVVVMVAVMVLEGVRRTTRVNAVFVSMTFVGLCLFVGFGSRLIEPANLIPALWSAPPTAQDGVMTDPVVFAADHSSPEGPSSIPWRSLPLATALMFVAYTGYGRVATLGEEVREPQKTIPLAIVSTVLICVVTYVVVAATGIGVVGATGFSWAAEAGAPLEVIAGVARFPAWSVWTVTVAAVAAMAGVVLNLILGLSRVALAMGRRGHLPKVFAQIDEAGTTPGPAVLLVAAITAGLVGVGSIRAAWSLSAVTVLLYYAITNAAALRLPPEARLYPRVFSWIGLAGCLGLSVFVEPVYWMWAAGVVGLAFVWHAVAKKKNAPAR